MRSLLNALAPLLVAASLLGPEARPARADTSPPRASAVAASKATESRPLDGTLDALAAEEDESLAQRRASGEKWSTGEIIVVVLLLIFLFPIGLIVLIVLLIVKA